MPRHAAKYLIVGDGRIGCSIAYHLEKRGEKDVVLLERAALSEGATLHAAGLVGQQGRITSHQCGLWFNHGKDYPLRLSGPRPEGAAGV